MSFENANSWWENSNLSEDPDLKRALKSKLNYKPKIFDQESLNSTNIYTLRGPRQVGKTVSLKLLIEELISKHNYQAKQILWTNVDTVRRIDLLESHLISLVNLYKSFKLKNLKFKPLMIIDEITSIPRWQRVIKKLRDDGTLSQFCLILTGSSAYDLRIGIETMAGRRGFGDNLDRVLLPMSYSDFRKQFDNHEDTFQNYLKIGGYPERISEIKKDYDLHKKFNYKIGLNLLEEVHMYEVNRRGLDRQIGLQVIARLEQIASTAVTYEGFAKALNSTKDTAMNHLNALGDAYLLSTYSCYDLSKKRAAPRKARKFLWSDPAFRYYSEYLELGDELDDDVIAESVLGLELLRRYENRLQFGLSSPSKVFTWKGGKGKEIDFLVIKKKASFPYELKYQSSISEWDYKTMKKVFNFGTLITKKKGNMIFKTDEINLIDLESFLLDQA
ncbi:MAG: ATP-binding protein [Bdellovibrionales bacterium]|nr:ATP-binding protein [Bdellovibrionales bacterium]